MIESMQGNRSSSSDKFLNGLSQSADYVGIGSPVLTLSVGLISGNKTLKREGIGAGIAILGTYGVGYILKKAVDRPRPFVQYPEFTPAIYKTSGSFPSGSTAIAFTTAANLTMTKPKWYVWVPAYAYASGVAYSRVKLAEHYPTDVLAGAVLGTASSLVSRKLMKWINK